MSTCATYGESPPVKQEETTKGFQYHWPNNIMPRPFENLDEQMLRRIKCLEDTTAHVSQQLNSLYCIPSVTIPQQAGTAYPANNNHNVFAPVYAYTSAFDSLAFPVWPAYASNSGQHCETCVTAQGSLRQELIEKDRQIHKLKKKLLKEQAELEDARARVTLLGQQVASLRLTPETLEYKDEMIEEISQDVEPWGHAHPHQTLMSDEEWFKSRAPSPKSMDKEMEEVDVEVDGESLVAIVNGPKDERTYYPFRG